jgi:hypothetical protein
MVLFLFPSSTNNLVSFISFAVSFNDIAHTIGDWSSKGHESIE